MNYFYYNKELYHCDPIFNWIAIDKDGLLTLFQNKPVPRIEEGYWTSKHTDSRDFFFKQPDEHCPTWLESLRYIGKDVEKYCLYVR